MKFLLGLIIGASGWIIWLYDAENSIGTTDGFWKALLWIIYTIISSVIGKILMDDNNGEGGE